ncbi:hypothetical protein OAT07_00210 [Candidatus Pelagibacter sp.]|nr:hypothetical protein [Candidatus Pelagibacter sp.]
MKIIPKENNSEILSNGFDNYEEKKDKDRNDDLIWLQQEAAQEPVSDALKIYNNTNSWYNGKFGIKVLASLRKRKKSLIIEDQWSTKIEKIRGDFIDYLPSVKLIDRYPFHKCDDNTIYIVPEGSTCDERPHDFLMWIGKARKCLAIEIQDFTFHSKPSQKIKDFIKAQFITFNPPQGKQFIPLQIAADQIKHEEYPSVIEELVDWLLRSENSFSEDLCDIPF